MVSSKSLKDKIYEVNGSIFFIPQHIALWKDFSDEIFQYNAISYTWGMKINENVFPFTKNYGTLIDLMGLKEKLSI